MAAYKHLDKRDREIIEDTLKDLVEIWTILTERIEPRLKEISWDPGVYFLGFYNVALKRTADFGNFLLQKVLDRHITFNEQVQETKGE